MNINNCGIFGLSGFGREERRKKRTTPLLKSPFQLRKNKFQNSAELLLTALFGLQGSHNEVF